MEACGQTVIFVLVLSRLHPRERWSISAEKASTTGMGKVYSEPMVSRRLREKGVMLTVL